jgi:uncharacterized membrane protein YphA (DoxX/SURF4 family)
MKRKILIETIALLFVFLLVYAAVSKLADFQKFRVQLGKSPLLTPFAGWVVWIVPAAEITISIMLVLNRWRLAGLYAALGLMAVFTFYILAITRFSDYTPCSCGGVLQAMTWNQHLIFNMVFVLLGIVGILCYPVEADPLGRKRFVRD